VGDLPCDGRRNFYQHNGGRRCRHAPDAFVQRAAPYFARQAAPARQIALDAGNEITLLDADQSAAWAAAARPVYDAWIADVAGKGLNGPALIDEAKALMEQYTAAN